MGKSPPRSSVFAGLKLVRLGVSELKPGEEAAVATGLNAQARKERLDPAEPFSFGIRSSHECDSGDLPPEDNAALHQYFPLFMAGGKGMTS